MSDWLKKLFAEPQTLTAIVSSGIVGFFVGVAQGIVQKRHGGWRQFFATIAMAIVVGVTTGLAIKEFVSSEAMRFAIVCVCAVIAEDIWAGLKTLGLSVRGDPLGFIARVVDALRGRQSTTNAGTADSSARSDSTPGNPQ